MKIIKLSLFSFFGFVSFQLNAQSLDEANRLTRNEQFEDAEKVFQELLTAKPKEANYYYYAGLNQILKGDTVAANRMFNTGIAMSPKCMINYVGKAHLALRQNQKDSFQIFVAKALTEKKKLLPFINKELARNYLMIEFASPSNLMEYAKEAEKLLASATDDYETKLLMGDAMLITKGTDQSQTIQQYITAGYESPEDPRPLLREARVYRRVQNYELSKIRIHEALGKDKDYAPAYRQMAEVFGLSKQNDSAIYYFKEYLKRNNNLSARRKFVEALYLNSQFDDAISEGNDLLAVYEFPNIYGVIAYAYVGKKNTAADENKEALRNFKLYEDKYVASMKRSLSQKETFNKANLLIRDSSISEGMRLYKSVLSDTAHTNDGWYDVAIEQLYNATRYNEAYEISKLKVVKKSGKFNKRDLYFMDRALSKSKRYAEQIKVNKDYLAIDSNYIQVYPAMAKAAMMLDKTDSTNFAKQQYIIWLNKIDSTTKVKQALEVETAIGNIAFLYQKAKNYEMASTYYGKVLELKANSFAIVNKMLDPAGKIDSSTIFTAEFVNLLGQPESLANNVRIGYVAMKLKNFEAAAEYYNKAEVLAPENKDISKMRALCDDYATYLRIDDTKSKLDAYLSKMKEREAKKKAAGKK